jgi:hypothetical protein
MNHLRLELESALGPNGTLVVRMVARGLPGPLRYARAPADPKSMTPRGLAHLETAGAWTCPECVESAAGACPNHHKTHRQCPCCRLCVRRDGQRRHCGGASLALSSARCAHDRRVPAGPVNR